MAASFGWKGGNLWWTVALLGVVVLAYAQLVVSHISPIIPSELHGQALYCRIALCFVLVAAMTVVSMAYPVVTGWMNAVASLVESYLLLAVFGLMLSLGWRQFDVSQHLMENDNSNRWYRRLKSDKHKFSTKERCLRHWTGCVLSFAVAKPVFAFITAGIEWSRHNAARLPFVYRIVQTLVVGGTLAAAIYSYLVCYRSLGKTQDGVENPFKNRRFELKVLVVKSLFVLFFINHLVLQPMILAGKIQVPEFLCHAEAQAVDPGYYCGLRLVAFIQFVEVFFMSLLALLAFRRADFTLSEMDNNSTEKDNNIDDGGSSDDDGSGRCCCHKKYEKKLNEPGVTRRFVRDAFSLTDIFALIRGDTVIDRGGDEFFPDASSNADQV